jgi:serine/threonine protein phosphatase 1
MLHCMIRMMSAPAEVPPGRRVYAVGDVHGCDDRLAQLHWAIDEDLAERPIEYSVLVHLGDYVDRGRDTAGVLARLANGPMPAVSRIVNLMGNHEEMMLAALVSHNRSPASLWLNNGGAAALASWGADPNDGPAEWLARIPPAHLEPLTKLSITYREGEYLFVHAGIRPGLPLDRQSRHDLLWIREPFLSSEFNPGFVVIHGHTVRPEPEVRANRIGIDTGAVLGGALTCAVLEGRQVGFLFS